MCRCQSWTIKKAECQRIDASELWCWRARRSNQSILKEISPEYSSEGLMLKLQYFGHLLQRVNSLEMMRGKTEGNRRRGRQRMRWWDGIINLMDISLIKFLGTVKDREAWCAAIHEAAQNQMWPSDGTTATINGCSNFQAHSVAVDINLPFKCFAKWVEKNCLIPLFV